MAVKHVETYRVDVSAGSVVLAGDLSVPTDARGVVVFAHGSGSSRHSPRNKYVAEQLVDAGLATLLMDLLTAREEIEDQRTRALRFDIALLAERVEQAIGWLDGQPQVSSLNVGIFGASTGAAAALVAAAKLPGRVHAVVSRGGRPDLAAEYLDRVTAATLLIVGGADPVVFELNRQALAAMRCAKRLEIVPGASHLFEEPGTLEQAAAIAAQWFRDHLGAEPVE